MGRSATPPKLKSSLTYSFICETTMIRSGCLQIAFESSRTIRHKYHSSRDYSGSTTWRTSLLLQSTRRKAASQMSCSLVWFEAAMSILERPATLAFLLMIVE